MIMKSCKIQLNCFDHIHLRIPFSSLQLEKSLKDIRKYRTSMYINGYLFVPWVRGLASSSYLKLDNITPARCLEMISNLDSRKSTFSDNIPTSLLKTSAQFIIITSSLSSDAFLGAACAYGSPYIVFISTSGM